MIANKLFYLVAFVAFCFLVVLSSSCAKKICPPEETTLILESGKDAWICNRPDYADRNFGDHKEILAAGWTVNGEPLIVRSLIEFDLAAIPEGSTVTTAKLYLQSVDNTTNGPGHSRLSGSNEAIIKWVREEWSNKEVTWNNQPATTEALKVEIPGSENDLQNYEVDLTEMVKAMLEDRKESHGFLLMMQNENYYRRVLFASADYDDPAKWPKLIIKCKMNQ